MSTRTRLNRAFFNGSLLLAGVVGVASGSFGIFAVTFAGLLAANVVSERFDFPGILAVDALDFPRSLFAKETYASETFLDRRRDGVSLGGRCLYRRRLRFPAAVGSWRPVVDWRQHPQEWPSQQSVVRKRPIARARLHRFQAYPGHSHRLASFSDSERCHHRVPRSAFIERIAGLLLQESNHAENERGAKPKIQGPKATEAPAASPATAEAAIEADDDGQGADRQSVERPDYGLRRTVRGARRGVCLRGLLPRNQFCGQPSAVPDGPGDHLI